MACREIITPQLECCMNTFRQEDRLFRLLLTYLAPELTERVNSDYDICEGCYDTHPATYKCFDWDIEYLESELRSNTILLNFFGEKLTVANLKELLLPMKQYFLRNELWRIYADVFGIDINTTNKESKQPLVLQRSNGDYLGHIYGTNCGDYIEFIGIRESFACTLEKIYNNNPDYRGIAYSILDGCKQYAKLNGVNKITLASPIGSMPAISRKYGFVNDELYI